MILVRAQLCASSIGNDELLYNIQFPTILHLIHNIYHWTKIEENIRTFIPLVFLGISDLLYFRRARVRARVRLNVKNTFFNRCKEGFHFESL